MFIQVKQIKQSSSLIYLLCTLLGSLGLYANKTKGLQLQTRAEHSL